MGLDITDHGSFVVWPFFGNLELVLMIVTPIAG